ncbi:MAG: efflux RND transporter periplasmic adaptor subunit [Bryobacteraceae bacterium]|nr:efflux RND transporter periplasmic adaptor subunit [Bryobacteraceae bacterium]MDW8377009.1 efflux RND transporter periplasmic adaptor subunit [Bryobacterales bacterium]
MKNLALFLVLLFTAGCTSTKRPAAVEASSRSEAELPVVEVARADVRRVDRTILVTGSLHPDETVTVSSEVPGRVVSVRADFGQLVRKGDVLVELDRTELQIALDRTRAALAQALARLGLDPSQADQAPTSTPAMRQALAQLEDIRFKYENAKKLVSSGDISQDRFNELEKAYRAREAAVEAARDEMRTLWANVEAIRAEVRLAEKRLRDATIRSPLDGSISERKVAPGQFIKDNTPLFTLVKTHPMRLRLEVPESAAAAVKVGTRLEFTTDAVKDAVFSAIVTELNPSLNEQSRMLLAEARLANTDARLRPGMFVQVRLILERDAQVVVVPRSAVYTVAGLTKVFLVREGKLVERQVPPGMVLQDWVEVPADRVRPGETVVVGNLAPLVDGQAVRMKG